MRHRSQMEWWIGAMLVGLLKSQPLATEFQYEFKFTCLTASS